MFLKLLAGPILFLPCFKISVECPLPVQGRSLQLELGVKVSSLRSLQLGTHSCQLLPADKTQNPRQVLEGQWGEKQELANRLFMTKPFSVMVFICLKALRT